MAEVGLEISCDPHTGPTICFLHCRAYGLEKEGISIYICLVLPETGDFSAFLAAWTGLDPRGGGHHGNKNLVSILEELNGAGTSLDAS